MESRAVRRDSRPLSGVSGADARKKKKKVYAEDYVCTAGVEALRAAIQSAYSEGQVIAARARPAVVSPEQVLAVESNKVLERLIAAPSLNSSVLVPRKKRPSGVPNTRTRDPAYPMSTMKGAEALAQAGQAKMLEFIRVRAEFSAEHLTALYQVSGRNPTNPLFRTVLHLAAEKNYGDVIAAIVRIFNISPDTVDSEGATPLVLAAAQGCLQACKALIDCGASMSLAAADGRLPLHEALMFGHYAIAEMLLMTGRLNVNVHVEDKLPALLAVLETKNGSDLAACCRLLCALSPDLNMKSNGIPPKIPPESAFDMCLRRFIRVPEVFGIVANTKPRAENQVNSEIINAVDINGKSVIFRCLEARCYDAVRGLLYLGANPAIVPFPKPGQPPPDNCLLTCIRAGHLDIGRAVMEAIMEGDEGSDINNILNTCDFQGYHPALLAARRIDPLEVRHWIDLFIKYRVELDAVRNPSPPKNEAKINSCENSSLLFELVRRGHVDAAMHLWDSYDERGVAVNVNEADAFGRSLVFYSCYRVQRNDRTPILHRLLRGGADSSRPDVNRVTPLIAACRASNFRACLMLLNRDEDYGDPKLCWKSDALYQGASANGCDDKGNTPLWYATLMENPVLCDLLLKAGAEVNTQCYRGRTALHLAVRISKHKRYDLFNILIGQGANPSIADEKGNTACDYAFMKEFEFNCRPMVNYFKRTTGLKLRDSLEVLRAAEDSSLALPNKGWGKTTDNGVKKWLQLFYKPWVLFSSEDLEPSPVRAAYLIATKLTPCDRLFVAAKAEAVYEGGVDLVKDEAKQQSIAAAKQLALLAVKAGAAAAGSTFGVDPTTVLDVIDTIEGIVSTIQDLMDAYQQSKQAIRVLNDGDYEGSGSRHQPEKYGCSSYQQSQRLVAMAMPPKPLKYYKGPKEMKPAGPNYKHKPHRFRPGERVSAFLEGQELIILRDYGSKDDLGLPYLAGCTCLSHEGDRCDMRRFSQDELLSIDFPLVDKLIKGELEISVRHDDVRDCIVITPHSVSKVKDEKPVLSLRVSLKTAKTLDANGLPSTRLISKANEDRTWPDTVAPLELFHIMVDDLAGETLFVEVFSISSMGLSSLLGGVALNLDGLAVKSIEHHTFALVKDYKDFALGVEDSTEEELADGISKFGFTGPLPQEIVTFIDNRHMAMGPPTFAGDVVDWHPLLETIRSSWIELARGTIPSSKDTTASTLTNLFSKLQRKFAKMDKDRISDENKVRTAASKDSQLNIETMNKNATKMATQSAQDLMRTLVRSKSRGSVSESTLLDRKREAHEAASTVVVHDTLRRQYFYACRVGRLRCKNLVEMRSYLLKYNKKAKVLIAQAIRSVRNLLSSAHSQEEKEEQTQIERLSEVRTCYKSNSSAINELFAKEVPTADVFLKPDLLAQWKTQEKIMFQISFSGKDFGTWSIEDSPASNALPEFMSNQLRRMSSQTSFSDMFPISPPLTPGPVINAWMEEKEEDVDATTAAVSPNLVKNEPIQLLQSELVEHDITGFEEEITQDAYEDLSKDVVAINAARASMSFVSRKEAEDSKKQATVTYFAPTKKVIEEVYSSVDDVEVDAVVSRPPPATPSARGSLPAVPSTSTLSKRGALPPPPPPEDDDLPPVPPTLRRATSSVPGTPPRPASAKPAPMQNSAQSPNILSYSKSQPKYVVAEVAPDGSSCVAEQGNFVYIIPFHAMAITLQ